MKKRFAAGNRTPDGKTNKRPHLLFGLHALRYQNEHVIQFFKTVECEKAQEAGGGRRDQRNVVEGHVVDPQIIDGIPAHQAPRWSRMQKDRDRCTGTSEPAADESHSWAQEQPAVAPW